jgi:hypothetical protein
VPSRPAVEDDTHPRRGARPFGWLSNGVTIICSRTSIVGKTYVLDDVQIVNGWQTSHSIYRVLRAVADDHPAAPVRHRSPCPPSVR